MNTISENLQRLVNAKANIANAITAKGGTVNEGDGFEDFATDIDSIPTGGFDYTIDVWAGRRNCKMRKKKINPNVLQAQNKTWFNPPGSTFTPYGFVMWIDTDGGLCHTYNSSYTYKLNTDNGLWYIKKWGRGPSVASSSLFNGQHIWNDGTNVYYSYYGKSDSTTYSYQYVLNKSTGEWSTKTWSGLTWFDGYYIWTDGENIYYSNSSSQYVFNKSTSTWSTKTWTGLTSFYGQYIWSDGDNIYYSYGSNQYVLNKETSTWTTKTWSGLTNFYGNRVWTVGDTIYSSDNASTYYSLSGSTWTANSWSGIESSSFSCSYIWTDGSSLYHSNGSSAQYVLDKSTSTWVTTTHKTITFSGNYIWTDGENIYYSSGSSQLVLDKSTSTWSTKTWTGLTSFNGQYIWSDGDNIYYSYESNQYVLNKETSTWTTKTWSGLSSFDGVDIWSDGTDIYYTMYSKGIKWYKLNKTNSSWSLIKSTSESMSYSKYGRDIWTDGNDFYLSYSYYSSGVAYSHLKVDVPTMNTSGVSADNMSKIVGSSTFDGEMIWTDGIRLYPPVMDPDGNNKYLNGEYIWSDGDNLYYSNSEDQFILRTL